jgi:hypothetical protein
VCVVANGLFALRFEKYPEDAAAEAGYGAVGDDPLGHLFPDFEYTAQL